MAGRNTFTVIRADIKPLRRQTEGDFWKAVEWKTLCFSKSSFYTEDGMEVKRKKKEVRCKEKVGRFGK